MFKLLVFVFGKVWWLGVKWEELEWRELCRGEGVVVVGMERWV